MGSYHGRSEKSHGPPTQYGNKSHGNPRHRISMQIDQCNRRKRRESDTRRNMPIVGLRSHGDNQTVAKLSCEQRRWTHVQKTRTATPNRVWNRGGYRR